MKTNIEQIIREEIEKLISEDAVGGATTTNGMTPDGNAGGYTTAFGVKSKKDPTLNHKNMCWERQNESTDVVSKPIYKPKTQK